MRKVFEHQSFYASSRKIINDANRIIEKYQAQGYTLTVRQLYYQFVSEQLLKNTYANYKKLADVISKARLAGLMDWDAIEDRTRYLRAVGHFAGPREFIDNVVERYYAEQLWSDQRVYCEVWIEKDALVGVIERVCNRYRVPYFPCRGFASQSAMFEAGLRLGARADAGKKVIVLHLGDHDPSGIDMTRDNRERANMFAEQNVEFRRLALNMDQVEQYEPPENPTKETDSRFTGYYAQFGENASSWELDALEPSVISGLIEKEIVSLLDMEAFNVRKAAEEANRTLLREVATRWERLSAQE